jgi:hypothetical protein
MGVLTEYLKSEVDQIRAEMARRKERLEEWLTAINRLYDQLECWLAEADNGFGILGVNRHTTKEFIGEPRLGHYEVYIMWVSLGGAIGNREAKIVPKARFVAATIKPPGEEARRADGMVEIKGGTAADYYLFRWAGATPDDDRWFIRSVVQWNADPEYGTVEPLDREHFETAMLRVLQ